MSNIMLHESVLISREHVNHIAYHYIFLVFASDLNRENFSQSTWEGEAVYPEQFCMENNILLRNLLFLWTRDK